MTKYQKAINARCSRRAYLPEPLEQGAQLRERITLYNLESGLYMRLVENDNDAMKGFSASYGMFSGARHFIAVVGDAEDPHLHEKAGYWGERLVLDATLLGLGTCWVGGTYRRDACQKKIGLRSEEKLVCIILVGKVQARKTLKEQMVRSLARRSTKPLDELYTAAETPENFLDGMLAVQKAPSALNKQPVHFQYKNRTVTAEVPDKTGMQGIDLGIAMLHFEIGSGSENRFGEIDGHYMLRL